MSNAAAPWQPVSSHVVKTSSMPACVSALDQHAAHAVDHGRDGGLVVGAENRAGRVAHDPVLDHRLDRTGGRHGVEMRAEEDRSVPAFVGSMRA